jgi:hypothetical protein
MGVPVAVLSSRSIIDWRRDRKDVVVAEPHGRVEGGGRVSLVRSAATQPPEAPPGARDWQRPVLLWAAARHSDVRRTAHHRDVQGYGLHTGGGTGAARPQKNDLRPHGTGFRQHNPFIPRPYILSPLPVALVHTSDMVSLPEGLKSLIPNITEILRIRNTTKSGREGFMHAAIH